MLHLVHEAELLLHDTRADRMCLLAQVKIRQRNVAVGAHEDVLWFLLGGQAHQATSNQSNDEPQGFKP